MNVIMCFQETHKGGGFWQILKIHHGRNDTKEETFARTSSSVARLIPFNAPAAAATCGEDGDEP